MNTYIILKTQPSADYELLDSGEGEKMERYGKVIMTRPDPQALWHKKLSEAVRKKAQAQFMRCATNAEWKLDSHLPEKWNLELAGLRFWIKPTAFKHTGIFPEHVANWEWIEECIRQSKKQINVLNLFGY